MRHNTLARHWMLVVAMMAVATIGCWSSDGLASSPSASTAPIAGSPPNLAQAHTSSSIADAADINDVLLLRPEETSDGPRGLYLVDATTGRELNFLPLDIAPMVTRRTSTTEVVVSDTVFRVKPDGTSEAVSSVKVFDNSLSTLKREFPIAGHRISYAVYAPAIELSLDEQTLWYVATSVRGSVECAGSSWDAALCEVMSAVAMDVDTGAVLSHTELPLNCGYPALNRVSARGMIVACTNRATVLILEPDGTMVAFEDFGLAGGFEPEITHRAGIARPRLGFEASDGSLGLILSSGKLLFRRPADTSPTLVFIADPSDLAMPGGHLASTTGGVIYIALGTNPTNAKVEEVAALNINTLAITGVSATGDAVGFGPSRTAAGEFIAVRTDGSVDVLGASGSNLRQLVPPARALGTEVIP